MAIEDLKEYLIERSKDSLNNGDAFMAKSWLLTCGAIFNDNFTVQYERFLMAKSEKNVEDASKFFNEILNQESSSANAKTLPGRSEIIHEKRLLVEVVKSRDAKLSSSSAAPKTTLSSQDANFYGQLFDSLSNDHKYQVLMSIAKDAESAKEEENVLSLMLLTLKMFPSKISKDGRQLLSHFDLASQKMDANAEAKEHLLIFEVLPLILSPSSDIKISFEELEPFLIKLLKYFVSKSIKMMSASHSDANKIEMKMLEIFSLLARKFNWNSSLFEANESIELILNRIESFLNSSSSSASSGVCKNIPTTPIDTPMDLTSSSSAVSVQKITDPVILKQLKYSLCVTFLRSFINYNKSSSASASSFGVSSSSTSFGSQASSASLILLENYNKTSQSVQTPNKKRKLQNIACPSFVDANVVINNAAEDVEDDSHKELINSFINCIKSIDLIICPSINGADDFFDLLDKIGVESMYQYRDFRTDACLYRGKHEELIIAITRELNSTGDANRDAKVASNKTPTLKPLLQVMSSSLIIHDYPSALHHSFLALELIKDKFNESFAEEDNSEKIIPKLQTSTSNTSTSNMSTPKSPTNSRRSSTELLQNSRQMFFLSSDPSSVLPFIIDVIVTSLKSLIILSIKPSDVSLGDLIVLSQYKYPKYANILILCLNMIKKQLDANIASRSSQVRSSSASATVTPTSKFIYHPFVDYVRLPDHLEEFMSLAVKEEKIHLELNIPSATASNKTMTTRGVNKNVKEEVKLTLINLMKKSTSRISDKNFIDFILNQMRNNIK